MSRFPLAPNRPIPSYDMVGLRKPAYALSLLLILLTLIALPVKGLNMGIDFAGGVLLEVRPPEGATLKALRQTLSGNQGWGEVTLQSIDDGRDVIIRVAALANKEQGAVAEEVKQVLNAAFGESIVYRRVDYVGPQVGKELIHAGMMSMLIAFGAMMLYIWMRFEWQFGLGGIIALIHDSILTVGFFLLLDLEFGLTSVAAILTIIGYSINDSVVIYDRVRENLRRYKKKPLAEIINQSLNETLSRTLLTGGSTLVALLALILFGGEVIRGFSLAVFFGVVVGTYSSVFVAAPLLLNLHLNRATSEAEAGQESKTA